MKKKLKNPKSQQAVEVLISPIYICKMSGIRTMHIHKHTNPSRRLHSFKPHLLDSTCLLTDPDIIA